MRRLINTFVLLENKKVKYLFSNKTNMEIEEMNHWWTEKEVRPQLLPKTKRELFNAVKADVDRRQIQVIVGLRRVGKSTIFYQLIDYLINNDKGWRCCKVDK
jgi:predicted AAA+ superfamily ATPase